MRAYLFWHHPQPDVDAAAYERALAAFHDALNAAPPDGFVGSAAHRLAGAPWLPGADAAFEDWYLIRDSAALDPLDTAAVSAALRPAHDAVAQWAEGGAGGLYRLLREGADSGAETVCIWLRKPAGVRYRELLPALESAPGEWTIWQRQMVLGPAPEFCLAGPADGAAGLRLPPEWQATPVPRLRVWPPASS